MHVYDTLFCNIYTVSLKTRTRQWIPVHRLDWTLHLLDWTPAYLLHLQGGEAGEGGEVGQGGGGEGEGKGGEEEEGGQ